MYVYESCENVTSVKLWKAYLRQFETQETIAAQVREPLTMIRFLIRSFKLTGLTQIPFCLRNVEHLSTLTVPEREFALDWSNVVQFIGPSEFDVNYTMTSVMQSEILPSECFVKRHDRTCRGLFENSERGTRLLKLLKNMNDDSKGELLHIYERAMCTSKLVQQCETS